MCVPRRARPSLVCVNDNFANQAHEGDGETPTLHATPGANTRSTQVSFGSAQPLVGVDPPASVANSESLAQKAEPPAPIANRMLVVVARVEGSTSPESSDVVLVVLFVFSCRDELGLHAAYAARWGVHLNSDHPPAPATLEYTSFLLHTAQTSSTAEILAAMVWAPGDGTSTYSTFNSGVCYRLGVPRPQYAWNPSIAHTLCGITLYFQPQP